MKEKDNKVIKLIVVTLIMVMLIILAVVGIKLVLVDKDETTKIEEESGKQEIATGETKEGITATKIEEDASYIGKYVNYGGQETFKGVKWRIFNAENGQIQLIAADYIKSDLMPTATNILKGSKYYLDNRSNYIVAAEENRITLLNYMNTTSNWSDFVAVTGATVTGGPTIEQLKSSYNRTHGASSEADVKEIHIAQSEAMEDGERGYYVGTTEKPETYRIDIKERETEDLYISAFPPGDVYGYWLGSPSASNTSSVLSVNYRIEDVYCYAKR